MLSKSGSSRFRIFVFYRIIIVLWFFFLVIA
jgi:hypothetical protein